jgi:ABC-type oligopeptide transport system substrate-binding subunit
MRIVTIVLLLLLISLTASCQNAYKTEVPKVVLVSFEVKYPDEKDPDFEQDSQEKNTVQILMQTVYGLKQKIL